MADPNPFRDEPAPSGKSTPMADRDAARIARQIAAEANAGRANYTMGMLIVVTIACAAILGVCGATLQNLLSDRQFQNEAFPAIAWGTFIGIPFGIVAALFVRISTPTIFLGGAMGGCLGAIATPAALYAEQSPTAALIAAALIGPLLILGVSFAFAHLSKQPGVQQSTPQPVSPWDSAPAPEIPVSAELAAEEEPTSLAR